MNPSITQTVPLESPDAEVASKPANPTIAVVIPAYNEEQGVRQTLRELRAALPEGVELIVVDDGSSDQTAEEVKAGGGRLLRHEENKGYGASLKTGILAAKADLIVITDADGTYPADALPRLLREAAKYDMVVGARAGNSHAIPFARRPAKWILKQLAQYLAGRSIPDLNSGMRVFRRSELLPFLPILPDGFSFTTTITLGMMCTQRNVTYVPIDYRKRLGTSKIVPADFFNFMMLVLRTIVLFNPLKVFLPLGTVIFAMGILKLMYDVVLWNLSESAVMAILGAIIVWSVGLLADMISRLHLRPPTAL